MKFLEWIRQLYTPATCEELMVRELDASRRDLLLTIGTFSVSEDTK